MVRAASFLPHPAPLPQGEGIERPIRPFSCNLSRSKPGFSASAPLSLSSRRCGRCNYTLSPLAQRLLLYALLAQRLLVLINAGIAVILAVSLNLINGITGQFSLGHAGFMAIGAYVSAVHQGNRRANPDPISPRKSAQILDPINFALGITVGACGGAGGDFSRSALAAAARRLSGDCDSGFQPDHRVDHSQPRNRRRRVGLHRHSAFHLLRVDFRPRFWLHFDGAKHCGVESGPLDARGARR